MPPHRASRQRLRDCGARESVRKRFFFAKKNQNTFARLSPASPRQPRKIFCFFFQKEALPSLIRPNPILDLRQIIEMLADISLMLRQQLLAPRHQLVAGR